MIQFVFSILILIGGSVFAAPLKEDTAVTVLVGPLVDWANGKTILADNDDFDPNDIVCRLVKGASESTLTLTKTGGDNNINLTGYGMATLTLTASNVDTAGRLQLQFCDAVSSGYPTETILPFARSYSLFADNTAISKFDEGSDTVTTDTASREASKATVSGLSTFDPTVDTVTVGNPDDCKADVSGLNDISSADVRTQVDASIESYNLDHLLLNGGSLADVVSDQTVVAWLMAIGGDISDANDVTDSLEAIRNQVDQIPTKPSAPRIR